MGWLRPAPAAPADHPPSCISFSINGRIVWMMPTVFARATSQRELPAFRSVLHYHPDLVNQVLTAVEG